jgi:PKD repeat protein
MKKQLLAMAALSVFGSAMLGQQNLVNSKKAFSTPGNQPQNIVRCGTAAPGDLWDTQFNQLVEQYKAEHTDPTGREVMTAYTIPVIVHVINSGEAVGTASNISAAQVADQIRILNEDYAGVGFNSNNVPYIFNGLKADCGIQFCLATQDESGNTLAEPGIDRVAASSIPVTVPGTGLTQSTIDGTIKPATIWNPVKYCNMWVLKLDQNLLGYATFPAGSTLTGIPGSTGSSSTDGLVMGYNYFGSIGAAAGSAPYNKGRTASHEIGHWLGLRHIWGDNGQCGATDYCVDTPPQQGGTATPAGSNYNAPTYPFQPSTCTRPDGPAGASVTNTHGDMFMNFMDYTNDAAMYMFTNDQKTRIQTTMANGTYRKFLGTHGLCTSSGLAPAAPVAGFDWERTIAVTSAAVCNGVANNFKDASRFYPTSWSWSVTPSTGVTIASATSQNPQITFANAGTYTVSLTSTNAQGSNTKTKTIVVNNCSSVAPTASFTIAATGCTASPVAVSNTSTGNPTPTYSWTTSPSTGVTINTATSTSPNITFANAGTYTVSVTATNSQGSNTANHTITISNCTVSSCDTLQNVVVGTDAITVYGAQTGGYLSGTSAYPVTYLSEYYTQPGLSGSNLTGMMTLFYSDLPEGTQGTGNIAFEAYSANASTQAPATSLRSDNVTLSTVMSNGISGNGILIYGHTFSTPVTLAANDFHVAIKLPTTAAAGDTVAVLSDTLDAHATNTAWLKFNNTWTAASTLLGGPTWSFCMFPIICPASVGLASSELNSKISVFPNPSSGIINLAYALGASTDLKIEVTNMLGQSVYASVEKGVTGGTKTIDLSTASKGVYMVTISTGTDKMVRKIVID